MANLKYKTQNMSNPQGKPRVYFCCHPEDFERYFELISEELLAKQNCAIYYLEDLNAVRDEEFFADLKQMQLFVMPVTTKLLCKDNSALAEEFPFAMESHIPVLPLMQESGLEELFNRKCGDLQFLDKYSNDPTAISYDEKLEKYLSSVLIGDELAEKIRAAFDAYVFLSYRKKDRKYAQELMRLIHKNEFCRDIAIWYDEFLTPGENFNDSIKAALQKSGLFVLAVTPNLVNEINYIMTTEYPMARQEGKPILPAELVPTDREQLAAKYEDIPTCTDAHNEKELSEALLEQVRQMAIQENDASPEHNFFIGLAYLGGVDVEVNHERAVSLITSSAEAGLVEAVEKLVEMYRAGLGVVRSYETAVQWQEKVVEQTRRAYEEQPNEETLSRFCWAVIDCGDYYKELGRPSKANEKYSCAVEIGESAEGGETILLRRNLAIACGSQGDILRDEGDLDGAEACYKKSLTIREELVQEAGTVKARSDLAVGYNRVGDVLMDKGDLSSAREYYEKAFGISEQIVQERGSVRDRRSLVVSYDRLGSILNAEGNVSDAKEYYQKALAISESIAVETETVKARRDLLGSYNRIGGILRDEGDLSTARLYYQKMLAISERLAREIETLETNRLLSACYDRLGDVLEDEGNLRGAKAYYEKALVIDEKVASETEMVGARRSLSIGYNSLGDIYEAEGNLSSAKEYYTMSLAIREELASEAGTVEARRDLSISYDRLGGICEAEGDLSGAKVYYTKSLAIGEELAHEIGTVKARRDLAISYGRLGDICDAKREMSGAKKWYTKALAILEELAQGTGTVEVRSALSVGYDKLGNILKSEGDLREAKEYYKKGFAISEELVQEVGTIETRRGLAISCGRLGNVLLDEGNLKGAKVYYEKALAIDEELARETGAADSVDGLAVSYYKMHCVCGSDETDYLGKAIAIYEKLCAACPGVVRYRENLETLKSL